MSRIQSTLVAFGVAYATLLAAGDQTVRTIHVRVLPTAAQQLGEARHLIGQIGLIRPEQPEELQRAIATAEASLEVVGSRWPADAAAVAESDVLLGELLMSPPVRDFNGAEHAARRGLERNAGRAEAALLYRILGEALQALNRPADAKNAFRAAEQHSKLKELNPVEQLSVFHAAGWFYDQRHDPIEAARHFRQAARLAGLSDLTRMTLFMMALERSEGTDLAAAKGDAAELESILARSRLTNYSRPEELAELRRAEAALTRFRQKHGP